jgi:hypothetical protein
LVYNARDQLIRWVRPADDERVNRRGWITDYTLDGSGAMTRKVERNPSIDDDPATARDEQVRTDTLIDLDGDRVDVADTRDFDATPGAVVRTRQRHRYDDAGNLHGQGRV